MSSGWKHHLGHAASHCRQIMQGFIDEEGEDEEADEDLGKKKLRSAARSKRGIVLSDDDD